MNLDFITRHRFISLGLAGVAALGLLLAVARPEALGAIPFLLVVGGLLYAVFLFASGPLARLVARVGLSVRWKVLTAIGVTAGLLVGVSIINIAAMDYMHQELHNIQALENTRPADALSAVDELESKQHGLFGLTPLLGLLALPIVLGLGVAVGWSVISPVRKMSSAMRSIASGDFSQTLRVDNNDELGELASRINNTAKELGQLHEATLAEERSRALRERITQVTLAQEEERRRISRELHDGLGPSLAAIVNRLRVCQHLVRSDPLAAESELEDVTHSLKGQIQDIRHLILDLRPLALDQLGLVGSIGQQLERFSKETGIRTYSNVPGELTLDPLAEVTLFRVVQECLSNVRKHASASNVELTLQATDAGLELSIEDDGRGFEPNGMNSGAGAGGVGLVSMRERAELVGGRLSVESARGRGCKVALSISAKEVEVGAHSRPVS